MSRLRPVDPRLLRAAPALRTQLAVLVPLLAVRAALTVAGAVLLARAVVDVWGGHAAGRLLLLAGVVAARAAVDGLVDAVGSGARDRARQQLRAGCLTAVGAAGPAWLEQQDRQRLAHTVGPGLDALDGYVQRVLPALVAAVVVPPVVLVAMARTDLLSAALLAATLPLVPLFLALVGLSTRDRTARSYATLARLSARVVDLLEGLPGLKVLGRAEGQLAAVGRVTERYRVEALGALRWAFVSGLVLDLLATLSVALVAVSAGLRLQAGHVGLTAALTVLLLAPEVYLPLRAVGTQYHAGADALEAAAAALEVLAAPAAPALGRTAGNSVVDLEAATVLRPGRSVPALRDVTLSLRAGEVVAVEGPSGSGKTTLLALLTGALVPTSGTVRHGAGRDRLAWCPQRPRPSSRTVAEELRLADPGATDEAVTAALTRCEAPGPDVHLGEGGAALSAGQRRRVVLARALLRARSVAARGEAALVLLDEPSEDLDAHGEAVVAGVVEELRALGAAVVLVTHSPALAAVADRRLRLDGGALVADARPVPVAASPVEEDRSARPADPAPAEAPAPRTRDVLRLLRADARGLGRRTAGALLLGVAASLSGLALTALSGWLLLRAAQHPELQVLSLAVVGVRTTALAKALLRYGGRLADHDVALRLLARTRVRVVAALVPLAPEGLGLWRRGEVLRRFTADVDAVQDALVRGLLPLAGALAAGAAAVAVTAGLAPAAALPLAGLLALTAAVGPVAARAGRRSGEQVATTAGRRDAAAVGWLEALPELWALEQHTARARQVQDLDRAAARAGRPVRGSAAAAGAATSLLAGLAPVVVLAAVGRAGAGLDAGVAALLAVAAAEPVAALGPVWAALAGALHRAGRVTALLGAPAPVPEPRRPAVPPASPVGLELRGADLAHPGCAPVLHDVGLRVRPGERVALVGRSGSGKSTVVAAALRLLDPVTGTAALAGADGGLVALRDLRAADLPPRVAGCLQDDHVFATTLRENLRVGRPSATDADLDDVAGRLGLLDWVRGLPDGWDTQAGADGARLSGGQRQRLLVARALLADPEVLVLDEPTAHLDPATEAVVMADVLRATRGRTLLVSTHRRTGLEELDEVAAVAAGRVRVGVCAV